MPRTVFAVAVVLQLLLALPDRAEAREASGEDEVRSAVSDFGRAFVEADVAYLRSHLTEGYVHVNGGSGKVLNRSEWLDWLDTRRAGLASGELVISEYSIGDMVVKLYGETAVVTGVVESRGIHKGKPFTSRIRFTNVWLRLEGEWLRAAFHDSSIPRPTP